MAKDISSFRDKIDDIDNRMLELLNERAGYAKEIAESKAEKNAPIYVPRREIEIINRLITRNKGPMNKEGVESVFREIISACRALEHQLVISYLGPAGTFTHEAANKKFGNSAQYMPVRNFAKIFQHVQNGDSDYGVVAIENSIEGVVNSTMDMLLESNLHICGEIYLNISHNLFANCKMDEIERVYSHPQGIAQCRIWLGQNLPNAETLEVSSTSKGVELASKEKRSAAIGSMIAGQMYGVDILARGIEDKHDNTTRFLIISRTPVEKSSNDRTSLILFLKNVPGALYKALIPFQEAEINLTRIESRPTKKENWQYMFYIDFEGHASDPKVLGVLEKLKENCLYIKNLGSYPQEESPPSQWL